MEIEVVARATKTMVDQTDDDGYDTDCVVVVMMAMGPLAVIMVTITMMTMVTVAKMTTVVTIKTRL